MHGRYANSMDFKIEFNQLAMTIDKDIRCTGCAVLLGRHRTIIWTDMVSFERVTS